MRAMRRAAGGTPGVAVDRRALVPGRPFGVDGDSGNAMRRLVQQAKQ